jgi:rfaE bifunctional protein nucleotidyltransferase chain/domain
MTSSGQSLDWAELLEIRRGARQEGKVVVWTNGCFDLLHVGHVRCLAMAKSLGDLLVVGVNSDSYLRRAKGPGRPLVQVEERLEILNAIRFVDFTIVFDEDTPAAALGRLQPDIHCKGAEYAPPQGKPIPEAEVVASYGGRLAFFPMILGSSTTELIRRIQRLEA